MLKTIQIIALLQGVFLLFILLKNRNNYKKTTFWLFIGSIISITLFLIGDDDNNLFKENADWFLFDSSLFVTFLFLFFRYFKTGKEVFNRKDFLFFIPNICYFIIEAIEIYSIEENVFIEAIEKLIEFMFLGYLLYILFDLLKNKSKHWILYVTIPIVLHMGLGYVSELLDLFGYNKIIISKNNKYSSYLLVIIAFLFYFITFYLISKPKELLPIKKQKKYKTSILNLRLVEKYKLALINAMEEDKLYKDPKLSIHKVSQELGIPRQYISEVLNLHLHKSFQDFINEYRIETFIESLKKDQKNQFTLLGMANEVGFNSKSSFNAIFKKHKGLTPTEYKKLLYQKV